MSALPADDASFLKWLSRRLVVDEPLEPGNELYEPLYEHDPDDPVTLIFRDIEFKEVQSRHFLSGFRGSGKTTELFRLREKLQQSGYFVAYGNALDYLLPSEPVDISDFLIVLAGAFGDSLESELHFDAAKEGCVTIHRNGEDWYDVHPIIRDEVAEIVNREQTPPSASRRR